MGQKLHVTIRVVTWLMCILFWQCLDYWD